VHDGDGPLADRRPDPSGQRPPANAVLEDRPAAQPVRLGRRSRPVRRGGRGSFL